MEPLLNIEHVSKYYGESTNVTKALDDVSFSVEPGEFVGIMGASGSGKTTMLQCISTLDEPTGGRILLDQKDITKITEKEIARFRSKNLGFVFQEYNLLDTLTLGENIELALTIRRAPKEEIGEKVEAIAGKLGILSELEKFPYEVSGGQKQRCACARALVNEPRLLLADEPTGALDSASSARLLDTMDDLNHDMGITILMVTHDAFTASHCSRILFLRDGHIFTEMRKGNKDRKTFFQEILDVMSMLGGDVAHVR
ncbi:MULTISPECIES: ABC transporter ATP-binding protein [Blautia]|uniref:ABC transporter ATP-binding protein n=1 Tax=Blautia TaxID=572511 RepID=UPI000BA40ADA|nr:MULTISPECIES: ABC transporter ATP-binding protein [Blautia]